MEPENCEGIIGSHLIHGRQKASSDDIILPPSEDEDDSEIVELFPALSKIRHEYRAPDEDFVLDERVDCTGGLVIGATVHVNFDSEGDGDNSSEDDILGPRPRPLTRLRRPLVLTSLSGRRVMSPYYGPFVLTRSLCLPEVLLPRDWNRNGFGSQPVLERPRHVLDSAPRAASQPANIALLSGLHEHQAIKQDAHEELLTNCTPPAEPTALFSQCYAVEHDYAMLDVQNFVDVTSPSSSSGGSCLTPDSLEAAAIGARDAHPATCQIGQLSTLSQNSAQCGKGEDKAGVSALVPISRAQEVSVPDSGHSDQSPYSISLDQAEQMVPAHFPAIGDEQQVPSISASCAVEHMRAITEAPSITTWKDIARRERTPSGGIRDEPFPLLEPADLFEDVPLMSSGSPFTPARDPCMARESAPDLFAILAGGGTPVYGDFLTNLLDDGSQKLALDGILNEIIGPEFQPSFDALLDSSHHVVPDTCGAQLPSLEVNANIPQIDDLEREFRDRFPNYGRQDFVQDSVHLVGKASRPQGREDTSEGDHNSPHQCGDHTKNTASSLSPVERADLTGDIAAVDTPSNATNGKDSEDDDSDHCEELTTTNKAYLDDTDGPNSDIVKNRASLDDTSSYVSDLGKTEASLDLHDTCSSGSDLVGRATDDVTAVDMSSDIHQNEEGSSLCPSDQNALVHSSAESGSQHSKTGNSDEDIISRRDCTPMSRATGIEEDPFEGCSSPPSPSRDLDALYLTQPSATKRFYTRADKPYCGESVPKRARTSWDQWFRQFKNIVAAGREKKMLSSETHSERGETEQHQDTQRLFPHRISDQEVPESVSATEKFQECSSPGCGCTTASTVVCHRRPLFQWNATKPHTKKGGGQDVVEKYHHPEDKRSATSENRCSIRLGLSRRARPPPLHKRLQWWVSRVLCSLQ